MNVVLLVVDSLRAFSLGSPGADVPATPFFDRLAGETICFRRAYASECWTLPTHMSIFTGLLPSEHGAHFQSMAYLGTERTLAEHLAAAGYVTEVLTRNSLFDETVPGATRGFQTNTRILGDLDAATWPVAIVLALAKPRVRRLIRKSGFFTGLQKERRDFLLTLARMGMPADRLLLDHALERMAHHRRRGARYFLFLNLYDVHAPYSPSPTSPLRPPRSLESVIESLALPVVLPRVSGHAYLRPGFRLSDWSRRMLLRRYHRAIELMDEKVGAFYAAARSAGLLDDTLFIVTADHGEAFGEHGLYFHDASVYDTHLRVPLWIHHPERPPATVDDVVSTRDLFGLIAAAASGHRVRGTLLDDERRAAHAVALAEHFHYPYVDGILPRYAQNLAAAVVGTRKAIVRRDGVELYDLGRDAGETAPSAGTVGEFAARCRRDGAPMAAIAAATAHLERWERTADAA